MFSGIIEEVGEVINLRRNSSGSELFIRTVEVSNSLKIGESISVDGVCLTAIEISKDIFKAFMSKTTLHKTTLGKVKTRTKVNLERAMIFGERLGGHFITGHVDAIGRIIKKDSDSCEVEVPRCDAHFLVPEGSIAIDGVSLTIAELRDNIIGLAIIPHTREMTTLWTKKRHDMVNIEYDQVGKYIRRFYEREKKTITRESLREAGF